MASKSFTCLILLSTLLFAQANASMYMETTYKFWDNMSDLIGGDTDGVMAYGVYMVWFTFAPLLAPLIYIQIVNIYEGGIQFGGIDADEVLSYAGIGSKQHCYEVFMNLIPTAIFMIIGGNATCDDLELELTEQFGLTGTIC